MKAIRVHAPGGPESMRLEEVAATAPAPGQAQVKLEACGVNYIDVYFRTGAYKAPLPLTPGMEGAGTVTALGAGVSGVKVGDRVAWTGVIGSYAQMLSIPADRLVALPDKLTFKDGAAAMLQGLTAHYLVTSTWPLKTGETALVQAAAGGMGLLLCQMARMRGRDRDRDRLHRGEGGAGESRGRRPRDPLYQAGLRARGQAHHRRPRG